MGSVTQRWNKKQRQFFSYFKSAEKLASIV